MSIVVSWLRINGLLFWQEVRGIILKTIALSLLVSLSLGLYRLTTHRTYEQIQVLDNLPKFGSFDKMETPQFRPIIILADKDNKRFCSATVVDNNYAITAAHCLTDNGRMTKENIHVYSDTGNLVLQDAHAAGIEQRVDYGLVKGDFSQFILMAASFDTSVGELMNLGPLISCGFPHGQLRLFCNLFQNIAPYNLAYTGFSEMFPGMSGGPVVVNSPNGPILIGINQAVEGDITTRQPSNSIFTPIMGLLAAFDIDGLNNTN